MVMATLPRKSLFVTTTYWVISGTSMAKLTSLVNTTRGVNVTSGLRSFIPFINSKEKKQWELTNSNFHHNVASF